MYLCVIIKKQFKQNKKNKKAMTKVTTKKDAHYQKELKQVQKFYPKAISILQKEYADKKCVGLKIELPSGELNIIPSGLDNLAQATRIVYYED